MERKHEIPDTEFRQLVLHEWQWLANKPNQRLIMPQAPHPPPPTTTRPLRSILKAAMEEASPPQPRGPIRSNSLQELLQEKSTRLGLATSTGHKELTPNQELGGHTRPGEQSIQEALMKKDKRLGLRLMGR